LGKEVDLKTIKKVLALHEKLKNVDDEWVSFDEMNTLYG
jgi:hypothetical protein